MTVEGITDANYGAYGGSASFRVPSTNGYAYRVLLDTNAVPTDVWTTVAAVDYHELRVWRTNLQSGWVTNALVRFIVHDVARRADGSTEDGLPPWIPFPPIPSSASEFVGAHLRVITPQDFPTGYPIPVVVWVEDDQARAVRVNGTTTAPGASSIGVKRGVGSGFLGAASRAGTVVYGPQVGGLNALKTINMESDVSWTNVSGNLAANTIWPAKSRIYVTGSVTNPAGSTLTIGAGTIVKVNPGTDFANSGAIVINGTTNQPVVFMPATTGQPWGGFIQHANNASFTATGAIFTGTGAQTCWYLGHGCSSSISGISSHRGEQALFALKGTECNLTLTDCACVALAGQFGHGTGGGFQRLTLTRTMVQGATSGGEYTDCVFSLNNCAFLDFYLTSIPFWQFHDGDEDAIYIVNIPTGYVSGFTNTLIGFTKDDGVDSGGGGSGFLRFKGCWFESTYHEANSLSGTESASAHADKDVAHFDDVFINCGQCFENGYGAVTGKVDHCLMVGNLIGFRFGDNYNWHYYGLDRATNSILINNYRDVWGMTWQPDTSGAYAGWLYRTNQMDVRSNFLTAPNPIHPSNSVWNPAADAGRLAAFLPIPETAVPGVGFATWTNQFALSNLFKGVPVGLSCFTTNYTRVDYTFLNGSGWLADGTLGFAPGEVRKLIYPAGFNLAGQSLVRLVLSNPARGELTGETNVTFQGNVLAPQVACLVGGRQQDIARIGEGLAISLSVPSAEPVSVDYKLEAGGLVLASGTLVYPPGQTLQWISAPSGSDTNYDLVRLTLSNPIWASLGNPSNYFLVRSPIFSNAPPASTLLARGAIWKYLDTGTNLGAPWASTNLGGWTGTNFNDSAWAKGAAPLGYGNTPAETTTVYSGGTTRYITTYFRTTFNATNVAGLSSLTFNLRRDDGAVIYLNGSEVYRDNMPAGIIASTTVSVTNNSGTVTVYNSSNVLVGMLAQALHDGANQLAVEIHQNGSSSSDIVFDLELIGNPATPSGARPWLYSDTFDRTNLMMGWSDVSYQLQRASQVTGLWSANASTSPATAVLTTNFQGYFRLRKP